jgi:hypothetical protein
MNENHENQESQQEQQDIFPFLQEIECPFCHRIFTSFPMDVKVFECGWCRNRVAVVTIRPGFDIKRFFSMRFFFFYFIMFTNPDLLSAKKLVPLKDSVEENRKNLYVAMEMFFFSILYITICDYMQSNGSTKLIFNCVFFPAIPLVIGFIYYFFFASAEKMLLEPSVPVIRPGREGELPLQT